MAIPLLLLNPYVDAILVIALGIEIGAIMNALTPFIARIPWVGGQIANAVSGMAQSITHACGVILRPISDAVGGTLHAVARLVDWTYSQFRRHAGLLLQAALMISGLAFAVSALRAIVHRLTVAHGGQTARIKTLERELHGIKHQVKTLEHDISRGIGEDVLPRLKHLDKELHRVTHQTIPAIEAADAQAASSISDLWTWVHKNVAIPGTAAFEAAVAVALTGLGLAGLRCSNFRNLLSKFGCGLGTLLNDLLGIVVAGLVLESVCEFLPLLEDAFGAVAGPITHLLTEVPLGDCETLPKSWSKLNVSAGPLPPAQTLGHFPS